MAEKLALDFPLYVLDVHHPSALLAKLIQHFHGDAHLSLEGDFKLEEELFENLSHDETAAIRRGTLQAWEGGIPYQHNFVVIPLSAANVETLNSMLPHLDLQENIWHLQIEQNGMPVFGAFDSFETVLLKPVVPIEFLNSLVQDKIVDSFELKANRD